MTIYKSNNLNTLFEFNAFDKQNPKRIQALLDCLVKEMFLYSNFSRMNNAKDLTFFSTKPKDFPDRVVIMTGIKSRSNMKLREVLPNKPEALKNQQIK